MTPSRLPPYGQTISTTQSYGQFSSTNPQSNFQPSWPSTSAPNYNISAPQASNNFTNYSMSQPMLNFTPASSLPKPGNNPFSAPQTFNSSVIPNTSMQGFSSYGMNPNITNPLNLPSQNNHQTVNTNQNPFQSASSTAMPQSFYATSPQTLYPTSSYSNPYSNPPNSSYQPTNLTTMSNPSQNPFFATTNPYNTTNSQNS